VFESQGAEMKIIC